jgi:hypothetical protein
MYIIGMREEPDWIEEEERQSKWIDLFWPQTIFIFVVFPLIIALFSLIFG